MVAAGHDEDKTKVGSGVSLPYLFSACYGRVYVCASVWCMFVCVC